MTTTEAAPLKAKGMCIATRCTTVDQFVEMFHRFVDEDSFFVSTVNTRPPGLETSFSVQLADGTPVLRGLCVVLQAWTSSTSPFKTPGVRLGIKRLTANSIPVFERLLVTRSKPEPLPPLPTPALAAGTVRATATVEMETPRFSDTAPTKIAQRADPTPTTMKALEAKGDPTATTTESGEARTPGSELVLPANPLQNLTDASLDGFVDCTLYEETGTFFAVDDAGALLDELVPPPPPAQPPMMSPRPVARISTPVEIVAEEPPLSAEPTPELTFEPPRRERATPPPMPVVSPIPITPPPRPPEPVHAMRESTPAGEITMADTDARPATRKRWLLIGGAAAAVVAAAVWIAMSSSSDDTAKATAKPTTTAAKPEAASPPTADLERAVVKPVEPEVAPSTVPVPDEPAPPSDPENGAPTAGQGPCTVSITSTPAGSTVHLDGKAIAPSPVTIATTCERHKIDIKHPRYQLASKLIGLTEGTPGTVDVTLQRPTHAVKVTSQPSGATIFIDGKRAGTTPTVLSVLGFSNLKLEVKKTGYAPVSQKLYSKAAQDNVAVKLTKW